MIQLNANLAHLRTILHDADNLDAETVAELESMLAAATDTEREYVAEHLTRCGWVREITRRNIKARLARAFTELEHLDGRSKHKARLLTSHDLNVFAGIVAEAILERDDDDARIVATLVADYVPVAYRQTPASDVARIEIAILGGVLRITEASGVGRGVTSRRPNGRGDRAIVRALKPGQAQGRIIAKGMYR